MDVLRQFLPKGVYLKGASQEYLNYVAMLMSTPTRKTFGWKTHAELMDKKITEVRSRVAVATRDHSLHLVHGRATTQTVDLT